MQFFDHVQARMIAFQHKKIKFSTIKKHQITNASIFMQKIVKINVFSILYGYNGFFGIMLIRGSR